MIHDFPLLMKAENPRSMPPEKRHEPSDVPLKPVIAVMAGLALFGILALIGLWLLFRHWTGEKVVPESIHIDSGIEAKNEAPPPRLQESPREELETWRAGEETELRKFAWVDREKRIVKVPIERAFELLISEKNQGNIGSEKNDKKVSLTPLELRQQRGSGTGEERKEK